MGSGDRGNHPDPGKSRNIQAAQWQLQHSQDCSGSELRALGGGPNMATLTGGPKMATRIGGPNMATLTGGPKMATRMGGPNMAALTGGPVEKRSVSVGTEVVRANW